MTTKTEKVCGEKSDESFAGSVPKGLNPFKPANVFNQQPNFKILKF